MAHVRIMRPFSTIVQSAPDSCQILSRSISGATDGLRAVIQRVMLPALGTDVVPLGAFLPGLGGGACRQVELKQIGSPFCVFACMPWRALGRGSSYLGLPLPLPLTFLALARPSRWSASSAEASPLGFTTDGAPRPLVIGWRMVVTIGSARARAMAAIKGRTPAALAWIPSLVSSAILAHKARSACQSWDMLTGW